MQKLFDSSLFRNKSDSDKVDWKVLSLVTLYMCKIGTKSNEYRKAKKIAKDSSEKSMMKPIKFE